MITGLAVGLVSLALGLGLGGLYFAGLGATVARLAHVRRPALLVAGSFLVRTAGLLAGLGLLLSAGWLHLLCGVLGFWLSRELVLRWWEADATPAGLRQR